MAEFIQKAYFKNSQGETQSASLYTTLAEVQNQGVPVQLAVGSYPSEGGGNNGYVELEPPVWGEDMLAYMKYGETTDSNATSARIKRSDGATKAILVQAQVPYGSQLYTTTGVFTIPAGISKLRVTARGAGGGGGGSLWDVGDREYLINSGGNGGRGGLSVQTLTVTPGVQYPVTVGRGGSGGSNDRNSPAGSGAGGGASSFLTVSATGGGGGGGGSYGSSGSSGTNGSPAGAGANGGSGSSGVGNGNGGIGANGSVLIEWGGDIS